MSSVLLPTTSINMGELEETEETGDADPDEEIVIMPTEDKKVYWIFLLWGIGVLLPWNAVITVFDYFQDEMSPTGKKPYDPGSSYPFATNGLIFFT